MTQLRREIDGLTGMAATKFEMFCDDLDGFGRAFDGGATTDKLLTRIRDDVGLGAALATLDLSGKTPDASHRDDLNALIAVATFEPDPASFEPWLRTRLRATNERREQRGRGAVDRAPREGNGVAVTSSCSARTTGSCRTRSPTTSKRSGASSTSPSPAATPR